MQIRKRNTLLEVKNIISERFYAVLLWGIIVLVSAGMNFLDPTSVSLTKYPMFIGAIGSFMSAGMLYKQENEHKKGILS
jgi:hypothetical protein